MLVTVAVIVVVSASGGRGGGRRRHHFLKRDEDCADDHRQNQRPNHRGLGMRRLIIGKRLRIKVGGRSGAGLLAMVAIAMVAMTGGRSGVVLIVFVIGTFIAVISRAGVVGFLALMLFVRGIIP